MKELEYRSTSNITSWTQLFLTFCFWRLLCLLFFIFFLGLGNYKKLLSQLVHLKNTFTYNKYYLNFYYILWIPKFAINSISEISKLKDTKYMQNKRNTSWNEGLYEGVLKQTPTLKSNMNLNKKQLRL